jgi:hypothetical protein
MRAALFNLHCARWHDANRPPLITLLLDRRPDALLQLRRTGRSRSIEQNHASQSDAIEAIEDDVIDGVKENPRIVRVKTAGAEDAVKSLDMGKGLPTAFLSRLFTEFLFPLVESILLLSQFPGGLGQTLKPIRCRSLTLKNPALAQSKELARARADSENLALQTKEPQNVSLGHTTSCA